MYLINSSSTTPGADVQITNFTAGTDFTAGTTTTLNLSEAPASENTIEVMFDGVTQHHDTYSVSGATITFDAAIPVGTLDVEVRSLIQVAALTPADSSVTLSKLADSLQVGLRNYKLMINGSMQVNQRGFTSSTIAHLTGTNVSDRFKYYNDIGAAAAPTLSRETSDVPTHAQAGLTFASSAKLVVSGTVASPTGVNEALYYYDIEGYDLEPHRGGDITFSFWAKSNKTGNHSFGVRNHPGTRAYTTLYNITVADTWQKFEITIPFGDETTGTWDATNGRGCRVVWGMMSSSVAQSASDDTWVNTGTPYSSNAVNLFDTASNYLQVTGVQIETGSVATPFELVPYTDDLIRCERYYQRINVDQFGTVGTGTGISTTTTSTHVPFKTEMRDNPTLTTSTVGNFRVYSQGTSQTCTNVSAGHHGTSAARIVATHNAFAGIIAGGLLQATVDDQWLAFSAEF